jgi:hypothetical protein
MIKISSQQEELTDGNNLHDFEKSQQDLIDSTI